MKQLTLPLQQLIADFFKIEQANIKMNKVLNEVVQTLDAHGIPSVLSHI